MSDPVLLATGLHKRFREGYGREALDVTVLSGVSLQVERAQTLAVVGASGSGKSTLLHLLGGLDAPTAGSVQLMGRDFAEMNAAEQGRWRNQHLGFVYQFHHLLPEFNALDNVAMPLRIRREPVAAARERAGAMLARVGLQARVAHRPAQLSGGERQRVAIAALLAQQVPLMLLDEPTAHLDLKHQVSVLAHLRALVDAGARAAVIALHDLNLAARFATHALVLGGAGPIAGRVDEVMSESTLAAAFEHPLRRLRTGTRWTYIVD